jgi:hypothetical protein
MASVVLSGDTSGTITVSAPAVSGSNTQTLVATTGTLAPIVSGTAVTTTGVASVDFTSIPSWVKRITVMFNGLSFSGTSIPMVQLGDAGGFEITGYAGAAWIANTTNSAMSSGFLISGASDGTYIYSGSMTITLIGSNAWAASGCFALTNTAVVTVLGGAKTLSDTLTQIRITTVGGANTVDAGTINILYE